MPPREAEARVRGDLGRGDLARRLQESMGFCAAPPFNVRRLLMRLSS
jgi:hypothetical protein